MMPIVPNHLRWWRRDRQVLTYAESFWRAVKKELARQSAKKALGLLANDTTDPQARRNAIRESAQLELKQLGEVQP